MLKLGQVLQRIIHTMKAHQSKKYPIFFFKSDIKDGLWKLAVSNNNTWNFSYALPLASPTYNIDDIDLVIPNSLQMGLSKSPPFF